MEKLGGKIFKVRISSKGQIVIPKEIRELYGFKVGEEVIIRPESETRIILERIPKLSEFFGILGDARLSDILLEERRKELEVEEERISEFIGGEA